MEKFGIGWSWKSKRKKYWLLSLHTLGTIYVQWVWKFNLKGNISANHDDLHSVISQKIDLTDTLGTK